MTIVDYVALDSWFKIQKFNKPTLDFCINYWLTNPNMQPPLRMVACYLTRVLQ